MSDRGRHDRSEIADLTSWASSLEWEDLPRDVRSAAVLHLLDAYGVAVASGAMPFGSRLLASLPEGGAGPARIIGSDRRVDPLRAALVNGTLVHGLEYDDTHIASVIHGSAVALGAAFSEAQRDEVTVGDVLVGFVVAWEVMVRLGLLAPGAFQARGFQTAAVCGAPAAALATGRLRRSSARVMGEAFGIATSFSSGLMAYAADGATVKRSHLGWAAHGGVAAIDLAEAGLTGPGRPVTATNGFLAVFAGQSEPSGMAEVFGDVGRRWHLIDAAYKLYPVCHYIHSYLDLVDGLRRRHDAQTIGAIRCRVHPAVVPVISDDEAQRRRPRSFEEAQYSLHYAVAQMYLAGHCTIEDLQDPTIPAVLDLASRVEAPVDPDLDFPGMFPAVIELLDHEGRLLEEATIRGPRGATVAPIDLLEEIRAKFVANTSARWSKATAEAMFEQLSSPDLATHGPASERFF